MFRVYDAFCVASLSKKILLKPDGVLGREFSHGVLGREFSHAIARDILTRLKRCQGHSTTRAIFDHSHMQKAMTPASQMPAYMSMPTSERSHLGVYGCGPVLPLFIVVLLLNKDKGAQTGTKREFRKHPPFRMKPHFAARLMCTDTTGRPFSASWRPREQSPGPNPNNDKLSSEKVYCRNISATSSRFLKCSSSRESAKTHFFRRPLSQMWKVHWKPHLGPTLNNRCMVAGAKEPSFRAIFCSSAYARLLVHVTRVPSDYSITDSDRNGKAWIVDCALRCDLGVGIGKVTLNSGVHKKCGFPKGWFWRMFRRAKNRNEGTFEFPMFPRNENRNEGAFACSPRTKTGTRAHSPKPPFYETALLSPLNKFGSILGRCSPTNLVGFLQCGALLLSLAACVSLTLESHSSQPPLVCKEPGLADILRKP